MCYRTKNPLVLEHDIKAAAGSQEPGRLNKRRRNMLGTILLIVLILMLIGAIPSWPHSRSWGYGPSSGLGLVVIIIIVLLLMGRL